LPHFEPAAAGVGGVPLRAEGGEARPAGQAAVRGALAPQSRAR
jgi:hypothetical protein